MVRRPRTKGHAGSSKRKAPVQVTGGSGFRYENPVAARFLLDMLAGKNALGPAFGRVVRVDWQARDAGWLADDFAVTCRTAAGDERAAGISAKDYQLLGRNGFPAEFARIAWQQWLGQNTKRTFRRGGDAIVLATSDLPDDVRRAWSDLSAQAIATESAPERLVERLAEPSGEGAQSSALQRAIFASLRRPDDLGAEQGDDLSERALLTHDVRVLKFDYGTAQSSDEVTAIQDCQFALSSGDHTEAVTLWQSLVGIADELRPVGGSVDLPRLLDRLRGQFAFGEHPDFRADWETLRKHLSQAMADIKGHIADADAAHLARDAELADITELLGASRLCILAGESGSGKSALASQLATERYSRSGWLSADDLNHKNAWEFTRALGLRHSLPETLLASPSSSLIVFDSAESYSSDALRLTGQLIREFLGNADAQHVHVLITVQFEAADALIRQLVQIGVHSTALNPKVLGRPSDAELDDLLGALPGLFWIVSRPEIKPLLLNLKVLDLTARTLGNTEALKDRSLTGLTTLIDMLWEDWIQRGDDKYGRSHVLMTVAMHEADSLSSGMPLRLLDDSGDRKALPELETSGLVRVKKERVIFTHDLLGDWARLRVLMGDGPLTAAASQGRLQSPRWHKAIRLFGQHMLEQSADVPEDWRNCVENVPDDSITGGLIRDLFLDSLFLATNASALLTRTWPVLIANKGALLSRLLDRFLFVATLPDARLLALVPDLDEAERIFHAFRTPELIYFAPMLTVLHAQRDEVTQHAPYEAARICALWLRTMPFELAPGVRMPWRQEAAELALSIAREIQAQSLENSYFGSREDKVVYEALLYAARDLPAEVAELSLELASRRPTSPAVSARVEATRKKRRADRQQMAAKAKRKAAAAPVMYRSGRMREPWPDGPQSRVGHGFQEACLDTPAFTALVQANPDAALEVLLAVCIEEPEDISRVSSSLEDFGLAYWNDADPPAYFRGPFLPFIRFAPEQGITFVLKLVTFATQRVLNGKNVGISLEIDGQPKLWRGGANAFRWHHDGTTFHGALVQSALMALEQWFYEQIDAGRDVTAAVNRIVSESESLAFAGVLFDLVKKDPSLLSGPLKPLFPAWRLWHWDFQLTQLRYSGQSCMPGSWFNQPQQLVALARQWHNLPHRKEFLLAPNGAVPRTMLSKLELRPFFEDVRRRWRVELDSEGRPEELLLLIERITPENYTFPAEGDPNQEIVFQWPEAIARKNEEDLRQLNQNSAITQLPIRCMNLLAAGKPLPAEQLAPLLSWLKERDSSPPPEREDEEELPFPIENTILGGIAVLVAFHLDWLREDASRIEWCRAKLKAVADNPPEAPRFDSEVAISGFAWDDFAAVTGVRLLAADPKDVLARRLVAQAITGFHYRTTASAMGLAFQLRDRIGTDFDRLMTLSVHWAALRMLGTRGPEATEADKQEWEAKKAALVAAFIDGTLSTDLPNLKLIDAETVEAYEERRRRAWPEYEHRVRRGSGGRREEFHPEMPGFDERVLTGAFSWLNPQGARSPEERLRWLALMRALLQLTFDRIPKVGDPKEAEIKGLPSGFDDWILSIVARATPHLKSDERPESFWQAIFDLGALAHEWVERFFWHWFTDGLRASASPAEFVRLWQGMVLYALSSPKWDPQQAYSRHDVEDMVIELLGLDARWNAFASDESFTAPLKSMKAVFAQAAQRWFTPRVIRSFLYFVVKPAAAPLLLPALPWIATAFASFDSYDWRDDIEGGLIEYLHVCWRKEARNILADPKLNKDYRDLLASVVSRGSHAAIALRDRVAAGATA